MNETERKAVHELLQRRAANLAETPDKARNWLIKEGIHDANGQLTPQYGGRREGVQEDQ